MAAAEEDFSSLPLTQRLTHKSWKARQGAYDELAKLFNTLDPDADAEYKKWQEYLKKMVNEANAVAHESALGAILAYVTNAASANKTRSVLAPIVVEKGLGSTRAGTKAKGLDILLMYIEVDVVDPVIEDIIAGLGHKTPKNVTACVFALREALRLFGAKVVNVKPLLKQLPKIFDHKDKNVRAEGVELAKELYRWLGPAITNSLNDLKPVQIKELNEQFEKLPQEKAIPERLLRSEQVKLQEPGGPVADGEAAGDATDSPAEEAPVDAYDLADPVNILDKLPKGFYEQLASSKWKDRKEALEGLHELAKAPKLEDGRYGELMGALGKRINDANLFVVIASANCIQSVASGLRTAFAQYRSLVIHPMLEKFKEKKQNVVEALRGALDAVYSSVSINEVTEDIVSCAAHKNPQVRSETLQWAVRCFKTSRKLPAKAETKAYSEAFVKAMEDGEVTVRESAAEALGTMMKVVSERVMAGYIEKLDTIKQAKVKEYFEKAEVKLVGGGRKAAAPSLAPRRPNTAAPVKKPRISNSPDLKEKEKENLSPPRTAKPRPTTAPARTSTTRSAAPSKSAASTGSLSRKTTATSATAKAAGPKKAAQKEDEPVTFKFNDGSAEAAVVELVGEDVMKQLGDSAWKTRLAAAQSVLEKIQQAPKEDVQAEAIVRALANTPGWKESNFQVMTHVFNIFQYLAQEVPSFNKAAGAISIPGITDKLGDMKVKKTASDCMTTIAEKLSLQFVLSQAYEPMKKQKSPKVLADSLMWIQQTLLEFGTTGIQLRDLIEFIKVALTNTNASVRNNAVTVLGTLRMFTGPEIRTFVQDLNPQLLATIDSEFEKAAAKAPPKPTKEQTLDATADVGDSTEDLFPRVDISGQVSGKLVEEMGNAQWKVRKEALDELTKIIEAANKRIKPNLGHELIPALKARLSDSNKNLAMSAVEIAGNLALAVGKPFEKHAKVLIGPMTSLLADQKAHVRGAATTALDNIHAAVGLDALVPSFANSLMAEQPQLRKDLLKWLGDKLEACENMPDLTPMVHPILACLQDRTAEVRKNAQVVLVIVAKNVGVDHIRSKAGDLFKGAALGTVMPYIEALGGVSPRASTSTTSLAARTATPAKPRKSVSTPATNGAGPAASKLPGASKLGTMSRRGTVTASNTSLKKETSAPKDLSAALLTSETRPKDQRAAADRGMKKWTFEAPRRDLVEFLSEQCEGNFSPQVHTWLFSTNHYKEKDYLAALTAIDEPIAEGDKGLQKAAAGVAIDVAELKARYIANTDLILKYITLRFFDTNTSMFIKCLELLEHLFTLLDKEGYHMNEYEANSFLPFFINKSGDPKETMRARIRDIMKQLTRIYPLSKFLGYLMKGLESKNARTRTACLEEIASLIKRNGMTFFNPSKSLPAIAVQLGDRDTQVRNGALKVITEAALLIGEGVWKYLGKVSEKDQSLVRERLKRVPGAQGAAARSGSVSPKGRTSVSPKGSRLSLSPKGTRNGKVSPKSGSVSPTSPTSPTGNKGPTGDKRLPSSSPTNAKEKTAEPASPTEKKKSGGTYTSTGYRINSAAFRLDFEEWEKTAPQLSADARKPLHELLPGIFKPPEKGPSKAYEILENASAPPSPDGKKVPDAPYSVDLMIQRVGSNRVDHSIAALKQIERLLQDDPEGMASFVGDLVGTLVLQLRVAFASIHRSGDREVVRLCKHLANALLHICLNPGLSNAMSNDQMRQCLVGILEHLADTKRTEKLDDGTTLVKTLNLATMKLLDTAELDRILPIVLDIIRPMGDAVIEKAPGEDKEEMRRITIMTRCFWRLSKRFDNELESVNAEEIMVAVHHLLQGAPVEQWNARWKDVDKSKQEVNPKKTARTVIRGLLKVHGMGIFDSFGKIPDTANSDAVKFVYALWEERKRRRLDTPSRTPSRGSEVDLLSVIGTPKGLSSETSSAFASPVLPRARLPPPPSGLARSYSKRSSVDDSASETSDRTAKPAPSVTGSATPQARTSPVPEAPVVVDFHVMWPEDRLLKEYPLSTRKTDQTINAELDAIFYWMLKEGNNAGRWIDKYRPLHDYRKKHPYVQSKIDQYLAQEPQFIREEYERGLDSVLREELGLDEVPDPLYADVLDKIGKQTDAMIQEFRADWDACWTDWEVRVPEGYWTLGPLPPVRLDKFEAERARPSSFDLSASGSGRGSGRASVGSSSSDGGGAATSGTAPVKDKVSTVADLKERLARMKKVIHENGEGKA